MKFLQINKFIGMIFVLCLLQSVFASAQVKIVAAENFYGQIARELGGDYVSVVNILENPQQDPHLYSATPSISRAIADADIVVYNGLSYDSWMDKLLSVASAKPRQVIRVADLLSPKSSNPHIWYDPSTMTVYAQTLTEDLSKLDKAHAAVYQKNLQLFLQRQQQLAGYLQSLKPQLQGQPVAATEPLFNLLAAKLGLVIINPSFQLQVANEGEPTAMAMRNLLNDLQQKKIRVLIYNRQVTSPLLENIKRTAQSHGIPLVGMTETMPPNVNYQTWMQQQLTELGQALTHGN